MVIRMLLPDQEETCGVSAVSFMVICKQTKKKKIFDFLIMWDVVKNVKIIRWKLTFQKGDNMFTELKSSTNLIAALATQLDVFP